MQDTSAQHPWIQHYPSGLLWEKRYTARSLPEMFDQAVATYGHRVCSEFLGTTISYREMGELVNKTAQGLHQLGIGKGSKVGLLLPNSPTYIIFYYAILKTGACVVNFNPLYTVRELEYQIVDSQTDLMITFDLKLMFDKVETLLASGVLKQAVIANFSGLLPGLKSFLFRIFKGKQIANWSDSAVIDKIRTEDQVQSNNGEPLVVDIDPVNDLAVLQYTGGTTGVPKGAMLTHANLTINVDQITDWVPNLNPGQERIIGILPFFHVFAMTTILNFGVSHGAELLLVPKFEIDDTLKLISKRKPTVMPGVPTLYTAMINHPKIKRFDLSSLKFCISGGAGLPVEVRQQFQDMTGCSLIEGYGLSETAPMATANPVSGSIRDGSIGVPVPATHISIRSIDDKMVEMPFTESGEICIKGPQVMPGYWNKPEETADCFIDGYFRTGDVGYIAEDGFIYIVDRLKDMIIASGFKIYPRQVEEAIYRFPAVEEVTVIGIPDEYRGEAPKAFIKLQAGKTATADEIHEFLKGEISKIELPSEIEFRDELPKTMIGKLSRKELREES